MTEFSQNVQQELSILLGLRWSAIGRAGSMLWLGFGNDVVIENIKKQSRTVREYAIHVSCPWRIVQEEQIFVASADIYITETEENDNIIGNSLFDQNVVQFSKFIESYEVCVTKIETDTLGGLTLTFNGNLSLEIFPDSSLREEYWRFIHFSSECGCDDKHIVVFDEME